MDLKDEPLLLATNPRGLDYDVAKVLSEASASRRRPTSTTSSSRWYSTTSASASKRRSC